ncbi:MAG: hypothetical protein IPG07_16425, partial [Crocinitomicaceae bacterium]|nr:hypothetical protein [Crocinitomicaceae bacterium]
MRAFTSSSIQFSYGDGIYEFRSDTTVICEMTKTDKITLKRDGTQIRLVKNEISV